MNRTERYRLEALLELAVAFPQAIAAGELARRRDIPRAYLARLVGDLAREGLIQTRRGPSGGVSLARPGQAIPVSEVLSIKTADHDLPGALNRLADTLRDAMLDLLEDTSLADLATWEESASGVVDYAI